MFPHQNYVYISIPFVPHIPLILSTFITSPKNNFISTNHEAPHCQLSPVPHYFLPLMPFLSTPFSKAINLCSSLNVKVPVYILITITITRRTCIIINSDISNVLYMILRHTVGGRRKTKVTTNQHLSCTLKTSRC